MSLDALFTLSQEFLTSKNQAYRRYFLNNTHLSERCNILLGQRGIGKTTMIVQHLLDYVDQDKLSPKIIYIQADHFLLGESALYTIAEQFQMMGGEFIALDEIHKYSQWSIELKSIYDSFPNLKILASGSSALEILKGTHDLSRRALIHHITGMSFREFIELHYDCKFKVNSLDDILENHIQLTHDILDSLKERQLKVLPLFKKYLQFGYYPYSYELQDVSNFKMLLEQNVHTTLESDLISIYPNLNANSIKKIKRLMIYIAQNAPFTPNWSKLRKFLELGDERTLKNYFKYLEDSELLTYLYKSSKQLEGMEQPGKVYIQNPNLANAISEQTAANSGTQREIFFYNMLSHRHHLSLPRNGDFLVDDKTVFEIGGKKKSHHQVKDYQKAYVVRDDIETGYGDKIPLWLFGFLY